MNKNKTSDLLEKYAKGNVAVFIDAANISKSVEDLKSQISYRKLKRYFEGLGKVIHLGFYSVTFPNEKHEKFLEFIKYRGYKIVTKPLKVIYDHDLKMHVRKANFDVEISVDAMELLSKFDTAVLFSGDSDFDYLVRKLRSKGKKVIVISTKYHISKELIASANKYFDLKKFREVFLELKTLKNDK